MDIESRLRGTRRGHIVEELFTNSLHFPLLNLFFELFQQKGGGYLLEVDPYLLLGCALAQAVVVGNLRFRGRCLALPGNLIAPALYTLIELADESSPFFAGSQHIAFWGYALAIGGLAELRCRGFLGLWALVAEHLVRTTMPLTLYILLELRTDGATSIAAFMDDASHRFISAVMPLLGLALGFAALSRVRNLQVLRATAAQLRQYSEWLLGRDLLSAAVADPERLALRRTRRAVLFVDIRGFTRWCERRTPEEVVALVNAYYTAAEPVWLAHGATKVKLTADEILLVFSNVPAAVRAMGELRGALAPMLARYRLGIGAGLHAGTVIEGLIGPEGRRAYDILGDSVNVAKRLCQAAGPGEVLISEAALREAGVPHGDPRELELKGKRETMVAYPMLEGAVETASQ